MKSERESTRDLAIEIWNSVINSYEGRDHSAYSWVDIQEVLDARDAEVKKLKEALRYYMTLDKNPAELGDLIFRKAVGDRAREALQEIGGEE